MSRSNKKNNPKLPINTQKNSINSKALQTLNQSKLTFKRKRFCLEYLKDGNASQAAIRAGYSKKSAGDIGCELLEKEEIRDHIFRLEYELQEKAYVEVETVITELAIIADSDITNYFVMENGELGVKEGAPPNASKAVSSLKYKETEIVTDDGTPIIKRETEIKLWSKLVALKELRDYLEHNNNSKLEGKVITLKLVDDKPIKEDEPDEE